MDLIYTDDNRVDSGVLLDSTFDLAFGADENDFRCTVSLKDHCCSAGCYLYLEDTEYGGIIDKLDVDTDADTVSYEGRTWHGILDAKVIEPLKETDTDRNNVTVTTGAQLYDSSYRNSGGFVAASNGTAEEVNGVFTVTAAGEDVWVWDVNGEGGSYDAYTNGFLIEIPDGVTEFAITLSNPEFAKNIVTFYDSEKVSVGWYVYWTNEFVCAVPEGAKYFSFRFGVGDSVADTVYKTTVMINAGGTAIPWEAYKKNNVDEYLIITGEANNCLQWLIDRMGLSDLFEASDEDSGMVLSGYQMNRYITGYQGIRKMLASVSGKLKISYNGSKAVLSAVPLEDYSQDEEWDSSQMGFRVIQNSHPVNHMVCLGKGELSEREVIHLYADKDGNISYTPTFTGPLEVTEKYDYANAESIEELEQGGREKLQEAYSAAGSVQVDFDAGQDYDIGDIVGARESVTGVFVSRPIVKKIVTINKKGIQIEYKVGE